MRSSKGRSDNAITALSFCHFGLLRNTAISICFAMRPPSLYRATFITLPCALLRSAAHPPSLCHAPSFALPRDLHRSATSVHPLPHQASNLSIVIHTRTATPHYRSAHHYPHPSTKDTIAASTMHTSPTRYAQIIHPNCLLYVDITALIHNSLQSYPQSTQ